MSGVGRVVPVFIAFIGTGASTAMSLSALGFRCSFSMHGRREPSKGRQQLLIKSNNGSDPIPLQRWFERLHCLYVFTICYSLNPLETPPVLEPLCSAAVLIFAAGHNVTFVDR